VGRKTSRFGFAKGLQPAEIHRTGFWPIETCGGGRNNRRPLKSVGSALIQPRAVRRTRHRVKPVSSVSRQSGCGQKPPNGALEGATYKTRFGAAFSAPTGRFFKGSPRGWSVLPKRNDSVRRGKNFLPPFWPGSSGSRPVLPPRRVSRYTSSRVLTDERDDAETIASTRLAVRNALAAGWDLIEALQASAELYRRSEETAHGGQDQQDP
jgi:hypothetical protein